MEKSFNILDSSMILVYDQQISDDNVGHPSNTISSGPTEFSAGLVKVESEKQTQRNKTKDDFLMEPCNEYYNVENCVISGAKEMESVAIDRSESEGQLSASEIGLDLGSSALELSRDSECLKLERKCGNSIDECPNTSEPMENAEFNLKMIEKSNEMGMETSALQERAVQESDIGTISVATNVLTQNPDNCPVSVDSGLRFLSAGNSIVVLAQDPNNAELSNIVSEVPISCGKEIGIERFEFTSANAGPISTNITENQPTFFQVELYSANPLQNTACQDPATIVSAQQVLTVPQLFSCQWEGCNTHFLSKDDLISHVTSQHVKPIQPQQYKCLWNGCNREGRGFDARYKILTHLRSHTGERPHVCAVEGCQKSFARLDNLKIHMRSHTGEKPYVCLFEGCNKSYANSSDRFKHRRTHHEKKPYRCKYEGCDKCYTDPSSLRKHHRRHQKEENKILSSERERLVILPVMGNE